MKKRTVWVAALMSLSVSGMAQQVLPKDVAGDKEYARVCKEYELRSENSIYLIVGIQSVKDLTYPSGTKH